MTVRVNKYMITGPAAGQLVEQEVVVEEEAEWCDRMADLNLLYYLSGGEEGWQTDEDGSRFVYLDGEVIEEGQA
jgi:hypothetical protein